VGAKRHVEHTNFGPWRLTIECHDDAIEERPQLIIGKLLLRHGEKSDKALPTKIQDDLAVKEIETCLG